MDSRYLLQHFAVPLLLVVTANTGAWASGHVGRTRAAALDLGFTLGDGTRLLGSHKTWRGLIVGAAACAVAASLVGAGALLGAAFGTLALLGDAASSCIKRRLRREPGSEAFGLDQLPEALLPLLVLRNPLGIGWGEVVAVAGIFAVLDAATQRLRRR